jgi:hypothetical protein
LQSFVSYGISRLDGGGPDSRIPACQQAQQHCSAEHDSYIREMNGNRVGVNNKRGGKFEKAELFLSQAHSNTEEAAEPTPDQSDLKALAAENIF